jgi:hypothetical protein
LICVKHLYLINYKSRVNKMIKNTKYEPNPWFQSLIKIRDEEGEDVLLKKFNNETTYEPKTWFESLIKIRDEEGEDAVLKEFNKADAEYNKNVSA